MITNLVILTYLEPFLLVFSLVVLFLCVKELLGELAGTADLKSKIVGASFPTFRCCLATRSSRHRSQVLHALSQPLPL